VREGYWRRAREGKVYWTMERRREGRGNAPDT
jgi:hypothetical protein